MDNWHFMDWSFRDKRSNKYVVIAYLSEEQKNDNSEIMNSLKQLR